MNYLPCLFHKRLLETCLFFEFSLGIGIPRNESLLTGIARFWNISSKVLEVIPVKNKASNGIWVNSYKSQNYKSCLFWAGLTFELLGVWYIIWTLSIIVLLMSSVSELRLKLRDFCKNSKFAISLNLKGISSISLKSLTICILIFMSSGKSELTVLLNKLIRYTYSESIFQVNKWIKWRTLNGIQLLECFLIHIR